MTTKKTNGKSAGSMAAGPAWATYEDEVADFFRSLGLTARTGVKVTGARGSHDVDVLIEFISAGIEITWVIECKAWNRAIPKERVFTLAGVVSDIGADRGVMVAESGFQGGAIRVAQNGNITLTSLEDLRANTAVERAQAEISAFTWRAGVLAEDARRLWAWAPPSAPSGPIATDAMVEFAATAFEFDSVALPKIARGSYPITLSMGGHFVAQDAAELKPVLLARLETAEQEADGYWTLVQAAGQHALTLVDDFTNTLDELVAAGRASDDELHEGAPARFVPAVRAVSDAAEALGPLLPAHVHSGVIAVMRWLPDNAYAFIGDTRPDWARVEATLTRFLDQVRADLDQARARPPRPPRNRHADSTGDPD